MKRLLLPFLLVAPTAHAAEADCSTIQLFRLNTVIYSEKAVFPEPARRVGVNLSTLKAPLKACGVTFTTRNQGEVITVQSAQRPSLAIITNDFRQADSFHLPLELLGNQGRTEGLKITLTILDIYTTYDASVSVQPAIYRNTAIGVKVDGGKLQPLFWNGNSSKVPISRKAKVVDFYVKTNLPTSWQRLTVNLASPKITVYRKAAFPTN